MERTQSAELHEYVPRGRVRRTLGKDMQRIFEEIARRAVAASSGVQNERGGPSYFMPGP